MTKALSPEIFQRLVKLAADPRSNPALVHQQTPGPLSSAEGEAQGNNLADSSSSQQPPANVTA